MIEKERLRELIEQGATVYYIKYRNDTYIKPLKLEKDYKVEFIYRNLMLDEEDLYEHKSDAEWDLEFGNVEKRIKFVKPKPFREIENEKDYVYDAHRFLMYKYSGIIGVYKEDNSYDGGSIIFDKPFNEGNYKEACRLIKKLFMGEE